MKIPHRLLASLLLALTLLGCASAPQSAERAPVPTTAPIPAPGIALAANLPAPDPAALARLVDQAALTDKMQVDPVVREGRLANGLTYIVRHHPTPENRAEIWLAINAGSLMEDDDQQGLAHFLEHMAFNGTRHFERQAIVDYLESVGLRFGPDLNAWTSFDETVYTLRVPTDRPEILDRALLLFEDWLTGGMSLEGHEIDKERGVVVEEWRLGRGGEARLLDRQLPVLLRGSRYAERLTIGKKEILEKAPHEALRRFYRDWYRPDLAAVIAVGDFDPAVVERRIRERFEKLPAPEDPRPRVAFAVPPHAETLFSIERDPEVTDTRVAVYYKHPAKGQDTYGDYRRLLVETIYDALMNARLEELTRQPDPPFLYAVAASDNLVRTSGSYFQAAGVVAGGVERGLAALLIEAERVDRFGFTATEVERVKKDLLRNYEGASKERDKSESRALAAEYSRHFLTGEPIPGIALEAELVRHFLPLITLEELNRMARESISEESRVILASGPDQGPSTELPTKDELLAVFSQVKTQELAAYVDQVLDEPLVAEKPAGSPVVSERPLAEVGVLEWNLGNGVKVILKPTQFKNDEVLLSGFSPGGTSLISDADFNSAVFATALLAESGLGRFSAVELGKALAGRRVSVTPFLSELEEGFNGGASPADVETMLQLVYLHFAAPRSDPQAVHTFLSRVAAFVEHRLESPETVFADKLMQALSGNHRRRQPLTKAVVEEIDLEVAMRVYRDRFADASDFTFVLVGSFEPAAIRPLVETYLGGLPSTGRKETFRDIGVEPPKEVVEVEVEKGVEPKADVVLHFSGEERWSRENLHALDTLGDALSIRLREALREDRGATYGVSVDPSLEARPRERYDFGIEFGCAPANVPSLVDGVFSEIRTLRKKGVPPAVVAKIQETQRRARETAVKENEFWLRALKTYSTLGLDPRRILDYDRLVASISPETIRDAARRYLQLDRYVLGVLHPEAAP